VKLATRHGFTGRGARLMMDAIVSVDDASYLAIMPSSSTKQLSRDDHDVETLVCDCNQTSTDADR